ncbi:MAG: hypothetical protein AABY22_29220, partial [Nanoarchaeota archaeon]
MPWKKYQKEKQEQSRTKLAFMALGLIVVLIILGKLLNIFVSFNIPITKSFSQSKLSLNNKSSVNLVFLSDQNPEKVSILSYNPKEETVIILRMSDQIYMDLPKGYGAWRLGSIYKLGQEENPKVGAKLLKLSLSKLLGLPMDRVVVSKKLIEPQAEIENWRKNPVNLLTFTSNINSDLTPSEALNIFWKIKSVRGDKVTSLD